MKRLWLLLPLVACANRAPKDAATFAQKFNDAYSQRVSECLRISTDIVAQAIFVEDFVARVDNSVKKERVVYNPKEATACLDALPEMDCSALSEARIVKSHPCVSAIAGNIKAGGDCFELEFDECVTGYQCDIPLSDCVGTCRKLATLGAACDATLPCADNFQCVRGLCRGLAADGQPCGGMEGIDCHPQLYCDGKDGRLGACHPRITEGACPLLVECAAGYLCVPTDDTGATMACEQARSEGEGCLPGYGHCAYGTACGETGTCKRWGGIGEPCGLINNEIVPCLDGFCRGELGAIVGTCTAPQADGANCTSSGQCESGTCDALSQKCIAACGLQ